jgi:hypothetical protein
VLVNDASGTELMANYTNFNYVTAAESELLRKFWDIISGKGYNLFVTFNGRDFDCPFLMLRSALHRIKPGFNLLSGSEWDFRKYHIDLLRELTFFGRSDRGARRKFTLDFYCQKFGIKSPKSDGMTGAMVGTMYEQKRFQEIADYCLGDVIAQCELFKFWNEYLNI